MPYPSIIYGTNKKLDLYKEHIGGGKKGETPRWTLKNCDFLESGLTAGTGVQVFLLTESKVDDLQIALQTALVKYIGDAKKSGKHIVTQRLLPSFEDVQLRQALQNIKETFSE
jgi:hypothetical protein